MSTTEPFSPGGSAVLAVTTTSASASMNANNPHMYLVNYGTNKCFVRWGVGAQTAVVTDMVILPNTARLFTKGASDTIAAICAASESANLSVTTGNGH